MDMYGFSPYMAGMPQQPQTQYMQYMQMQQQRPQQMPQMQQPQSNMEWIPVQTVQQVEQVQVNAGGKAWIMVQNKPIFALRTADNMGLVTTDYYEFKKINPNEKQPQEEYVTRAEFNRFIEMLRGGNTNESTNASNGAKQSVVANYATTETGQSRTNSNANNADKSAI